MKKFAAFVDKQEYHNVIEHCVFANMETILGSGDQSELTANRA